MGKAHRETSQKSSPIISPEEKKRATIAKRQDGKKIELLDALRRTFVVEAACQMAGVSRATYYRWLDDDQIFALAASGVQREARDRVSDKAESNVISLINKGNFQASKYWLQHHRNAYKTFAEKRMEYVSMMSAGAPGESEDDQHERSCRIHRELRQSITKIYGKDKP